jgi:predicted GH43/DUF377 family glycosyl hydrolase
VKLFSFDFKKARVKNISVLVFKKRLWLEIERTKGQMWAVSQDGLEFEIFEDRKGKLSANFQKIKKQRLVESLVYGGSLSSGSERMVRENLKVEGVVREKDNNLVFFDNETEKGIIEVGVLATETWDSGKVRWRGNEPVWKSPPEWQGRETKMAGVVKFDGKYLAYWWVKGLGLAVISYPKYRIDKEIEIKKSFFLDKPKENPMIAPNAKNSWEAFTTFNPAAIYEADKVHILYRAQGFDYVSVLGYANSQDGLTIDEKMDKPAFVPSKPFEVRDKNKPVAVDLMSGGGCEGCEDPRITRIDDRIYMTYVAFNGWDPPRIALTSIRLTDFLAKRWLWEKPVLISPPKVVDKSACILPEKIGDRYVIFHRIFPNILIDYVDSLDFEPGQYLKGQYKIGPRSPMWWDSRKIGVGAPPLKTKDGWLLIYQSVDDKDASGYKVGAMMLDLEHPEKELYRSRYPIMEPDAWYDNQGFKAGVVYPCGAVIIDGQLLVYYGGADSHVCVATANLDEFLSKLKKEEKVELKETYLGVEKNDKKT